MGDEKDLILLCDFDIGDLVTLRGDDKLQVGYGLVADIKFDFDDIYDIKELSERIKSLIENTNDINFTYENDYPSKPQVLVLWNSLKNSNNNNRLLWMYSSDLILVQKVQKQTK